MLNIPRFNNVDEDYPAIAPYNSAEAHRQCSHMHNALPRHRADRAIREAIALIDYHNIQFDTFAFRGMSGAVFAPVLAYLMNKEMIMVRKNRGKGCASGRWVEGFKHARRYILVDDLISSGDSAIDTILAVKAFTDDKAELINILLYNGEAVEFYNGFPSTSALVECAHKKFEAHHWDVDYTW